MSMRRIALRRDSTGTPARLSQHRRKLVSRAAALALEPLEQRQLLTAIVLNDTGDHSFYVRLDTAGTHVQVYEDATPNDTTAPTPTLYPTATYTSLTVQTPGTDQLTLDVSNGNPAPNGIFTDASDTLTMTVTGGTLLLTHGLENSGPLVISDSDVELESGGYIENAGSAASLALDHVAIHSSDGACFDNCSGATITLQDSGQSGYALSLDGVAISVSDATVEWSSGDVDLASAASIQITDSELDYSGSGILTLDTNSSASFQSAWGQWLPPMALAGGSTLTLDSNDGGYNMYGSLCLSAGSELHLTGWAQLYDSHDFAITDSTVDMGSWGYINTYGYDSTTTLDHATLTGDAGSFQTCYTTLTIEDSAQSGYALSLDGVVMNVSNESACWSGDIDVASTASLSITNSALDIDTNTTVMLHNAGTFTIADSTVDESSGGGVDIQCGGSVTLDGVAIEGDQSSFTVNCGSLSIEDSQQTGYALSLNGAMLETCYETIDWTSGDIDLASGGSLYLSESDLQASGGSLRVTGDNTRFELGSHHFAGLVLADGSTATFDNSGEIITLDALSLGSGARLDLGNNDVIVQVPTGQSVATAYAALLAALQSGANGGTWDGSSGIVSFDAAANPGMALGLAKNADLGLTEFDGESVDDHSILLKYTTAGDANLDGYTDSGEIGAIIAAYSPTTTGRGWGDGDANYDGLVNAADLAGVFALSGWDETEEGLEYSLPLGPSPESVTWHINWGDGDTSTVAGPDGSYDSWPTHVYADGPQGYTISLSATDEGETTTYSAGSMSITVDNAAPFIETADDQTAHQGDTVSLSIPFSDAGTLDTHTATIDWGDGSDPTSGTITESDGSGTITASHPYNEMGDFTPTITLTDSDGDSADSTLTVHVNSAAPILGVFAAGNTIHLNWLDRCSIEDDYLIQKSTDGSSFTTIDTVEADSTDYTDDASGDPAWYRVVAETALGDMTSNVTYIYANEFSTYDLGELNRTVGNGEYFLGRFGDGTTHINLGNVPQGQQITVSFDLYLINEWDGETWSITADSTNLLDSRTFSNALPLPEGTQQAGLGYCGDEDYAEDTKYYMSYTFAHGSGSLDLALTAALGSSSATWGIDNLSISTPTMVTVEATDPVASKDGTHPAVFQISRVGDVGEDMDVYFRLSGTAVSPVYDSLGALTNPDDADYVLGASVTGGHGLSGDLYAVRLPRGQASVSLSATALAQLLSPEVQSITVSLAAVPTAGPGMPAPYGDPTAAGAPPATASATTRPLDKSPIPELTVPDGEPWVDLTVNEALAQMGLSDPSQKRTDAISHLGTGCKGLVHWYGSWTNRMLPDGDPAVPDPNLDDAQERNRWVRAYLTEAEADAVPARAGFRKFVFAIQGEWADGKGPQKAADGTISVDSIATGAVNYNYMVKFTNGAYAWMNHGWKNDAEKNTARITVSRTPCKDPGYPKEIWVVRFIPNRLN